MIKWWLCWVIIPFLIALLIAGVVFEWEKAARKEAANMLGQSATGDYPEITGFALSEYISGKKKMEIRAEKASIRSKRIGFLKTPLIKEAHMIRPEISFYAEDKEVSHIKADSGRMDISNKKIDLRGEVVLAALGGNKLLANQMTVDPKAQRLSVRDDFVMIRDGDAVKGKGFKSDIELKSFSMKVSPDK